MTTARLMIAALVVCAVPACNNDDDDVVVVDPVQDATDAGVVRGGVLADTAFAEISPQSDYAIVLGQTSAIVAAMNNGVIDQADFATQVVVADDIANFANLLASDHDVQNANLDNVMAIFDVGFIPSQTESDVTTDYALGLDDLHATAPSEIDFAYIDLQVRNHAANGVLLDQLRDMVNDDEMGAFLDDMRAMEDDHLAQAQDLMTTFF